MIRIAHFADAHVGMPYSSQKFRSCRKALRDERIESVRRAVAQANGRHAHFLVVAGDLFDGIELADAEIAAVAAALAEFTGHATLILPGNHDHVSPGDDSNTLWGKFDRALDALGTLAAPAHLLLEATPVDFEIGGQRVRFFPCPCTSKTSERHAIGWVRAAERLPAGGLHVGIAHGNLEGLGLDSERRYFNMTRAELESSGLDLWLLGHVHRPSPVNGGTGQQSIFMPGTTAPEDVKSNHGGTAWLLEIEGTVVRRHELLTTGRYDMRRFTIALTPAEGIAPVQRALDDGAPEGRIVDLQLTGELTPDQYDELNALLREYEDGNRFLVFTCTKEGVKRRRPAHEIVEGAPAGSRTRKFLTAISEGAHAEDLYLAQELMNQDAG
jgi:3',5'-cyclic AMP phosphodiesterase CpdA